MKIPALVLQAANPFIYQTAAEIEQTLEHHGWNVGVDKTVAVTIHNLLAAGKLTHTVRNAPNRPWQYALVVKSSSAPDSRRPAHQSR